MIIFKLPDLGEGLPDAQIREWYVKEGDTVTIDQPLVAMETAKALVDVPAAQNGVIAKCYGAVGDTIHTGDPLIGFEGEHDHQAATQHDRGTVVGNIEMRDQITEDDTFGGVAITERLASPAVRTLARRRGVDLSTLAQHNKRIHMSDVKNAAKTAAPTALPDGYQTLPAVRRAMILSMTHSQREVVPVTLTEDADVNAWYGTDNVTIRLIRAMAAACQTEPMLNAHFDGKHMAYKLNTEVNIGLAVDTEHGLYVPVLKNVTALSDDTVRTKINLFKEQAKTKHIAQDDLHGATIILSNFGTITGRYATPILLPPMTAIVGVGKLRDEVIAHDGAAVIHKILPLSVTIDHRAITGGEAARFLKALIEALK